MRRISSFLLAIVALSSFLTGASAQTPRMMGVHQLQLDDRNGNTITLQTPSGGWSGNVNYMLPQPPYPMGPSGWIAPGTLDGQIPIWDVASNSWQPQIPALALNVAMNNEPFLTFSPATSLTNSRILNSGLGISLVPSGGFPNASYTVSNTGVLSNISGAGISVSGATGDVTIANTGVLSTVAGSGINVSSLTGDVTIDNTGVLSNIAGAGISLSGPNGNVTISNTGVLQIMGTPNQILINGLGNILQNGILQLSTPQDIAMTSSPTFAGMKITGLSPAGIVHNDASGVLSSSAVDLAGADVMNVLPTANGGTGTSAVPADGQILIGNGGSYTVASITGTLDEINVANAAGSITLSTPQPIATTSTPTFSALTLTGKGTSASTVSGDVGATLVTKDFVTSPGNVAVATNTSLTGDGTLATPLGINLNNSNTFTADQLFPNTPTQGDNLISAVNASLNLINAFNIGVGLTDAQVDNDLTIDGGSVNNSPIGNTGANTGAFTNLDASGSVNFTTLPNTSAATDLVMSNAGTLETRTIASLNNMITVATNPSLVGDGTVGNPLGINLNNSNTFTADQLLQSTSTQGDNLISAVNASANTINAVNIGNGLTDLQVNDALTIDGGSVNNSPIGNTGANTGAFTNLDANGSVNFTTLPNTSAATDLVMSNSGTLETRTIASLNNMITVATNPSLVGDGTVGNPLGINLNNSNTFVADQYLPNSSTQGDNVISVVNASANTINAVNIGNGLTDAQVNDVLTIDGGSVNNSPIGNTGANTGAFTTLDANSAVNFTALPNTSAATDLVMSNSGTLETRTIASLNNMITVATNPSLVGDGTVGNPLGINLNNSNTFVADQLLQSTSTQGDNLISAVNASANTINAVNIGNGLTDVQVNDALTIDGGSVNNSPIGNTGANTGAFTNLDANGSVNFTTLPNTSAATDLVMSNAGTLETRTIASLNNMITVATNPSLVGDGTVGNPLGINLNNSNTFTADQLVPNSSTQGDNLISAVNASANTINAVNIGNGLTDAQVNDALTIDGGSVNNSPIGNTGANTGAFTTLDANSIVNFTAIPNSSAATDIVMSNSGTLETRTIASLGGVIAVNTDPTLSGDGTVGNPLGITLDHSNTYTADQLLVNSSTQGDNLISVVNASSNTINAVNIGSGLTDAQVNDNLTIDGGSVNNSPIGNTGANTGAFTTIDGASLSLTGQATSASTQGNESGNTLVTLDYIQTPGNAAVIINSTLTGNGTSGNPLDFNLGNTNNWLAEQLLPANSNQGDNLIAAINTSSNTINAANIGNGLSDAQINDNITIDGGSVNNSPIGNTGANTGAFTTLDANSTVSFSSLPNTSAATEIVVSNAGVLETRSISSLGNAVTVTTGASLVGDGTGGNPLALNLNNQNTWTADQLLSNSSTQGDNLIAAVNASSNTINASNIGSGLTDAQVNNNLTISGGTVDGTPIGATTASTGRFTTITATSVPSGSSSTEFFVSNAGALESRSLSSFADQLWQVGGNAIAGTSSIGSTSSQDVSFIRGGTEFMRLTSPAAVNKLQISVPTVSNATANTVGTGTDVTMLTVNGLDLGTAGASHLLVQGNARITQKLTVNGTISASSIDATPIGGGVRSTGYFTTLDVNNGLTISNNKELTLSGAVNNKFVSDALAAGYTLGPQDHILVCTNAGAGNVNLPANPPAGRTYIIKSMGAGNINVVPANAGVLIDGAIGNYVITGGLKSFTTLVCDGTDWYIISK